MTDPKQITNTDPRAIAFADHMMRVTGRGPMTGAEVAQDMRRTVTVRRFVCQGCGKVANVLYGTSIICSCGTRSATEIVNAG